MNIPLGREDCAALFKNSLADKKLAQAYILSGDEGIGKKTLMNYILSLVMCQTHTSCGKCNSCKSLSLSAHPDVYELKRPLDRASIGVDSVRDMMPEVYVRPAIANYKAVVVYEAHLLTAEAQNAMLKIIEEPPEKVIFFLLCDTLAPVLQTILSRCVLIDLKPLSKDILRNIAEGKASEFELDFCCGNPGKLKKISFDEKFSCLRDEATDKLSKITSDDEFCVYRAAEFFEKNKDNREELMNITVFFLRDALFRKLGMDKYIINKDKIKQIDAFSKRGGAKQCFKALDFVLHMLKDKGKNGNYTMTVTTMLFKCREEINGRSYRNTF